MAENQTVRIVIVDDHLIIREGLEALLEPFPDLQVVGGAETGREGIGVCRRLKPDVVLMDLVMPGMDGVEATRTIREQCPGVQVLALTSFKDDRLVRGVVEAGAVGFLLKNIKADQLAEAIRAASRGEFTIDPEANRMLLEAIQHPSPSAEILTEREREVLSLVVLGHSNSAIGKQLGISPHTVKNHLRSVYEKLNVSTRTAATRLALKYDLLEND